MALHYGNTIPMGRCRDHHESLRRWKKADFLSFMQTVFFIDILHFAHCYVNKNLRLNEFVKIIYN